jgi:hypothetical protein
VSTFPVAGPTPTPTAAVAVVVVATQRRRNGYALRIWDICESGKAVTATAVGGETR